ncbi:hypothetical protein EDB29_1011099 [Vibrio crassostreae]|uniref:Gp138 family membrane-puncturing spike protein n=1 Tax=Vibrio crassostreae TaxID=246167 RepID=UPI00104C9C48|nr:Gp138 family membrane-puncturing spike protein [Vibrio crassostreae]CAH6851430.1 hypothetical protein VCHA34P121_10497 [Vibrio chagasii]TCT44287.1 hypothetical protein EDB29_1011099 [Vibrio crassostreae]CAH6863065.1 hypothetical protein VCHA28FP16_10836 [Vibrio chagasii]CAH6928777.1 hypothetical protein VCHA48P437_100152 [Vibrio chagasii]CAH6948220.1 hypothetical protein VCHA44O286_110152 [Vibrio chagasii]
MIEREANEDSLSGLLRNLKDNVLRGVENSLPAIVTEISGDRTRVSVKPLIKIIGRNNRLFERAEIHGLPLANFGAGGFFISFNVRVGDLGWIEACDRDISLFLQSYDEREPNTLRKHSFSDSKFVPDIMRNFVIDDEDSDCLVIQNRDSSVKLSMNDQRIKLKSPHLNIVSNSLEIESESITVVSENIDITSSEIDINSSINISGSSCEIDASSFIVNAATASINGVTFTPDGNIVSDSGISLTEHTHAQGPSDPAGDGPHSHGQQDVGPAK